MLRGKRNKKQARPSWAVGRGLQIPLALGESEAAAAQLCSLSCVSGGPRDLKQAHSFCEPLGPPQREAVVKRGNWQLERQAGCFVDCTRKARPIVGYYAIPLHPETNVGDRGDRRVERHSIYLLPSHYSIQSFHRARGLIEVLFLGLANPKRKKDAKEGGGGGGDSYGLSSHV